ncbi:MAG: DUF177 domain-containing protein [Bacteroidales bacterium]|nr:DUF177 domain-containing protein [Bacteroidales bacterium]
MKFGNQYIIPFKGLNEGKHEFVFEANHKFFEEYNALEVTNGNVKIQVSLTKKTQLLELDFFLEGTIEVQCDRCLDYFSLPISYKSNLFVKFGEEDFSNDIDILILPPNEHELNIAQYIYECIGLSIPYKKIHPPDSSGRSGCNPEMIKKLEQFEIKNTDIIDPRWEKLKNIFDNKN